VLNALCTDQQSATELVRLAERKRPLRSH
jgi:hypothetical protein